MRRTERISLNQLFGFRYLGILLLLTLFYWLYNAFIYVLLGSFLPLIVILTVLLLIIYGLYKSVRALRNILIFWSILLMVWSGSKLLLGIVNHFVKPIPEAHVANQLGLGNTFLNLAFFVAAIIINQHARRKLKTSKSDPKKALKPINA